MLPGVLGSSQGAVLLCRDGTAERAGRVGEETGARGQGAGASGWASPDRTASLYAPPLMWLVM